MSTTHIGYAFTLLAVIPALRQVAHSRSYKSVAGVSAATTVAWVFSWSAWVWYGVLVESGPMVLRNVVGLLPSAALLVMFARLTPSFPRLLSCGIAGVYLCAATLMVVDRPAALVVMTVLDVCFYVPSVVRVFKDRDLSGVSVSANVGQLALSATWVAFLWHSGQGSASFGWCFAVLGYFCIVLRLLWLRWERSVVAVPASVELAGAFSMGEPLFVRSGGPVRELVSAGTHSPSGVLAGVA